MRAKHLQAGLTLVEVLVVLFLLFVIASAILPQLANSGKPGPGLRCTINLRQVGFAYHGWAQDHGGRFPAAVPMAEGGWRELLTNDNAGRYCWTNYAVMGEYLGRQTRVIICPADIRKPATNLVVKGSPQDQGEADFKGNCNVSYFVGVGASSEYPQSILGGDRTLSAGSTPRDDFGFSPADNSGNDVKIETNRTSAYCWSLRTHSGTATHNNYGSILFADGSARLISNNRLRYVLAKAGGPKLEGTTNSPGQEPSAGGDFRLVFP